MEVGHVIHNDKWNEQVSRPIDDVFNQSTNAYIQTQPFRTYKHVYQEIAINAIKGHSSSQVHL